LIKCQDPRLSMLISKIVLLPPLIQSKIFPLRFFECLYYEDFQHKDLIEVELLTCCLKNSLALTYEDYEWIRTKELERELMCSSNFSNLQMDRLDRFDASCFRVLTLWCLKTRIFSSLPLLRVLKFHGGLSQELQCIAELEKLELEKLKAMNLQTMIPGSKTVDRIKMVMQGQLLQRVHLPLMKC